MAQLTVCRFVIDVSEDSSVSNEQDVRQFRVKAIQMPTAWTAADIGFYSRPGLAAGDPGNETSQLAFVIQAVVATYRVLTIEEQAMAEGCAFLTLRSLDSASLPDPEAQLADRLLIAVVEPRH